ncbi:MAG: hypothetical protein JSR83_12810 [Proteobacteria bacterium]|nr:hypothetical protein [Pseudomonadota bacterium]
MASKRGLVIVPPFFLEGGESMSFPGGEDRPFPRADLRRYTLYWDRLEFPKNNVVDFFGYPEVDYLQETGVLQRTEVIIDRQQVPNPYPAYLLAQAEAFRRLESEQPGLWAIGQSGRDFVVPHAAATQTRAVELELIEALPIPPDNVSLPEVLEFKSLRGSELLALRATLDALYLELAGSADIPRAKTAAIDRVARSIADLNSAAKESWPARIKSSLKIELNIPEIAAKAAVGCAIALGLGVPPSVGAAVGAASAASLKINVRDFFAPKLPAELRDFAYVYHHVRELR